MYSFSEILLTVYTNYWEEHNNPSVTFFFKIGNYPILCVKVMHTHFFYYFILKFEIQLLQVHGSAKVATWSGKYKACDTCNRSVIACANGRQIVFACMVPCCPVVPLTSVVASTSSTQYTEMGWVQGIRVDSTSFSAITGIMELASAMYHSSLHSRFFLGKPAKLY
jgi:hypothetical protein